MSPSTYPAGTDNVGVLGSVDMLLLVQRMVAGTPVPSLSNHHDASANDASAEVSDGF